tara:strand:+ start:244 stop:819 length:576 start_codon:yes stop_codon:yes gene_type:complete
MEEDAMTDKGKMIEAVYKADLSKRATLVIFYLINRANKDLTCFPGVKTIAADCNMSDRTVRRALDDLVDSGFVKKEARYRDNGGQSSNLYTLVMVNETKANKVYEEPNVNIESVNFTNYTDNMIEPTMYNEELLNTKEDSLRDNTELDYQKSVIHYEIKRSCSRSSEPKHTEYIRFDTCVLEYTELLILPP